VPFLFDVVCTKKQPSNHLDIESVDAIIQGLSLFKGGVLLVSHDEHLITNAADEIWVATGDGNVVPWKGTFVEYKQSLLAHK
jgi:ATP-binding cassette subfamily F protein 3